MAKKTALPGQLKFWRERHGLTVREAMGYFGIVSTGNYWQIETGASWPNPEVVLSVLIVTDGPWAVRVDDLLAQWAKFHAKKVVRIRKSACMSAKRLLQQMEINSGKTKKIQSIEGREDKGSKSRKASRSRSKGQQEGVGAG